MADITMPQLGETVTEGTITRWLKAVGDTVAEDEVLFEVSTDKVDSEVPSPTGGVIAEILVAEGETVDVGTRLAVVSDAGSAPAPSDEPAAATASGHAGSAAGDGAATGDAGAPAPDVTSPDDAASGPQAPAPETEVAAPAAARAPQTGPGEQRNGSSTRPADDRPPSRPGDGGKVLSPVVRRLIAEHQLDPTQITGTGAGGRITRSDVLDLIDQRSADAAGRPDAGSPDAAGRTDAGRPDAGSPDAAGSPDGDRTGAGRSDAVSAGAAPTAPAASPPVAPAVAPAPRPTERDTVVPFTNIRRRTAEHMVRSKATSAHTLVAVEVDYAKVEAVRSAEKARFKEVEGFGLTYLPFISRAVVDVLADFPNVNSSVGDDELIVHRDINLGIAVDLDFEGLLVPVLHQADGKRLRALARDISALAGKARGKRLTMDDISGGTLTLTNAGPFGTFITVPVINQPQVAIISTDGVRKRPVVVELADGSDSIAIHPVGVLAMSWDHRAFDGAYAAAFLAAVRDVLESRDWAAEL